MLPVRGATRPSLPRATAFTISIHAPRAGSDPWAHWHPRARWRFQSMLPVRGATGVTKAGFTFESNFNPCSPCGERLAPTFVIPLGTLFQSMLPVRGATNAVLEAAGKWQYFNPCSPCGERPKVYQWIPWIIDFNPCSPCGERRQNQTKYGLYFGKIAEVSDRQQQRFGMYEVKHERLERLQGHFEKFRGANGRRIF